MNVREPLAPPEKLPRALEELRTLAQRHGWNWRLVMYEDSGGAPYLVATLARGRAEARATWHTRESGTYRLFGCIFRKLGGNDWRDLSLRALRREVVVDVG